MDNYAIVILGTGAHHNEDFRGDANKLMAKLAQELKTNGHAVESATFTYGEEKLWYQRRATPAKLIPELRFTEQKQQNPPMLRGCVRQDAPK